MCICVYWCGGVGWDGHNTHVYQRLRFLPLVSRVKGKLKKEKKEIKQKYKMVPLSVPASGQL